MPLYEYGLKEGAEGCQHCRDGFSIIQHISDDKLTECPECGAKIQRLIFAVGINTPKTNTELKDLGFTKLVKRDDGVYENVTQRGDDAKYMERGKKETIPDISKIVSD